MPRLRDRLTDAGYGLGWSVVCRLPESWAQRGFRGLRPLHGVFRQVTGNGKVTAAGQVAGTLTVAAGSIDTKNKMRDKDLRSAKLFAQSCTAARMGPRAAVHF